MKSISRRSMHVSTSFKDLPYMSHQPDSSHFLSSNKDFISPVAAVALNTFTAYQQKKPTAYNLAAKYQSRKPVVSNSVLSQRRRSRQERISFQNSQNKNTLFHERAMSVQPVQNDIFVDETISDRDSTTKRLSLQKDHIQRKFKHYCS